MDRKQALMAGCPPPGGFRVPIPAARPSSGGLPSRHKTTLPKTITIPEGAFIAEVARHPEFLPFERTSRTLPAQGWHSAERSPNNPTRFELADVRPEAEQAILVLDYQVLVFGFSGVNSYDYVPRAPGRFSGSMGYAVYVNGSSPGNLEYQLVPTPSTHTASSTLPRNAIPRLSDLSAENFERVNALNYGAAAAFGRILQPQNTRKFGADGAPWSHLISDDMNFQISGAVFRPIEAPIAFVEVRVSGYTTPKTVMAKLLDDFASTVQ